MVQSFTDKNIKQVIPEIHERMKGERIMKKRSVFLLAALIGLMLTACGELKEAADSKSGSTARNSTQENTREPEESQEPEESSEPEKLPASQEYVSLDGSYKVILLEGLTQADMQLQPGATMMDLEGESVRTGFSAISVGSYKSSVPGNPGDIENLEDYADYITTMLFGMADITVNWEDTDAPSVEGAEQCLAKAGVAKSGFSRGQAYGFFVESADSYFSVLIVGNDDDVEDARQIIGLQILERAPGQGETKDFINGMTAVLDSVNGANLRETFKMLVDLDTDASQLETLSSQARQSLSASWGVENSSDLMEMADWLIYEGHNQDAWYLLREYDGLYETDHDAFDAKLKEQDLDEETYISLLAAYDAWFAYGDGGIAAWDLSRVGTIMGFGYVSGYCTYEEAMDKTLEAAEKAQELYDSWEDFNQSYLYGYSYWAEESLDDPASSAAERAALVNSLASQANGPFSVNWNTDLEKEW